MTKDTVEKQAPTHGCSPSALIFNIASDYITSFISAATLKDLFPTCTPFS